MKLIVLALCLFGAAIAQDQQCVPCIWNFDETIDTYSKRMLKEAGGPTNGTCPVGTHVWWHFGADYEFDYNSCCCLPITSSEEMNCSDAATPKCDYIPRFQRNDTIIGFYQKAKDVLGPDAPENGCCPDDSYKYIFQAAYVGQDTDICGCIHNFERVDN